MKPKTLYVIQAPHFYAGIVFQDEIVVESAPIISYMKGWSREKVEQYVQHKHWHINRVPEKPYQEKGYDPLDFFIAMGPWGL
jgi:hypothetical protein